ncbi:MAG: Outer membrane lipoprotein Blc [Syntrophus sp. SKADARSKE-3]|nr:Outer membrane lipoprotein Blc [Syntrophus sp. SKADARSKE-3]
MTVKTIIRLILILTLVVSLASCIDENKYPPLSNVPKVDINRYSGLWYEIARIDHSFQKDCVASTAEYSLRDDGYIKVVNKCRKKNLDGEVSSIEGKAWIIDKSSNAWLKVQFFWPFNGDYVIIGLDEKEYQYAVVGHPSRDYLWILSRKPRLDEGIYKKIMGDITKQGYDVQRIRKYPQVVVDGHEEACPY